MSDEFLKPPPGSKLTLTNVTVTGFSAHYPATGFVKCRRITNWEKLRHGGALYASPCECIICQKLGLAF